MYKEDASALISTHSRVNSDRPNEWRTTFVPIKLLDKELAQYKILSPVLCRPIIKVADESYEYPAFNRTEYGSGSDSAENVNGIHECALSVE